ncbi:MAG: hypothetical protein WCI73_01940 [Phycisphaerae bacterium]
MQKKISSWALPRGAHFLSALVSLLLLLVTLPAAGQGMGDFIYTVGTTTRDSAGRDWAYILWQATQPQLMSNKVFAVYAKSGLATNTAPYSRVSIVQLQTDPRVIEPLLTRAQFLGDDLNQLQVDLSGLFGSFIPPVAISRGAQLSAVFRGTIGDPRQYPNLMLLARNHAGVSLALGLAYAQPIPSIGSTTFEVRAYDLAKDQDQAVLGRVTVEAGAPVTLPAPGAPIELPEKSAMGDLNVRLRWGTPDDLRRLTLMQFGYDLYRVSQPYAAAHSWGVSNPPPLVTLLNLVSNAPAIAKRVNRRPITPMQLFTLSEASAITYPGNTNTFFIMDDDGRGRTNYVNLGFTNGAKFYYYVAARDVLGRSGSLSLGTLATICDRLPPLPPTGVEVVNDYYYNSVTKTNRQTLRVKWKQNLRTNDSVSAYWIYRWTNLIEFNALSRFASSNRIAVVPHVPDATKNSFLDPAPGSAAVYDRTLWYSVRAVDTAACDTNYSGPAGPAYGVLRDRVGPAPVNATIGINCLQAFVTFDSTALVTNTGSTNLTVVGACNNSTGDFEWAEFYAVMNYSGLYVTNHPAAVSFGSNPSAQVTMEFPRIYRTGPSQGREPSGLQVFCRAALPHGKVSDFKEATSATFPSVKVPGVTELQNVFFIAYSRLDRVAIAGEKSDCQHHSGGGGVSWTNNISISFYPSPTSAEYRFYRRVDGGPLSLLAQGGITNIAAVITVYENAPPVNGGTVCFYLQLLDSNGNPSPMMNLGCADTEPVTPLPVPVLAKIKPLGSSVSPGMKLSWFCPPYGVDRFELRVARLADAPPAALSGGLVPTTDAPVSLTFTNGTNVLTAQFASFITPHVGSGFGSGADFTADCRIQSAQTYAVAVRAVGKNGFKGDFSDFQTFAWIPTNAPSPQVPWPARALPTVAVTNWPGGLLAVTLSPLSGDPALAPATFEGNAVLLGQGDLPAKIGIETLRRPVRIGGFWDPNLVIKTNFSCQSLFPCALYRVQITNSDYPVTSGGVIQVSPLMERVAWQKVISASSTNTVIHDPFVVLTQQIDPATQDSHLRLWLTDTQPVVSGATYRYLMVRFRDNHEIDQIIPSNDVTVP